MPFPAHMQRKDLVAGQGCYIAVACMHISQYVSNGWGWDDVSGVCLERMRGLSGHGPDVTARLFRTCTKSG